MSYCSIHNHTEYSNIRLLDSINKVSSLFDRAIEIGLKGFAITDHECLSAHVQAVQKRKELVKAGKINEDFKLILGDEIYLIDDIEDYKENYTAATHSYYHFIVLAKDPIGYEALKEISSTAWNNSYTQRGMERVPIEKRQLAAIMKDYKGHVIASTACLGGELAKFIVKLDEAERKEDVEKSYFYKQKINDFIDFCEDTFGKDDFYLEMQPSTTKEQIIVNKRIISISGFYGLKVIYSTDSHYESKERRLIHKSYLNAMDGEREVDDFYSFTYMMSIEEVYDLMKEYIPKNIFDIFTDNTLELMSKCENYDLFQPQIIPEVHVVPENFIKGKLNKEYLDKMNESEYEQDRYWVNYCVWSLKNKGLYNDSYLDRLNIEAKEMWLISEKLGVRMTSYYNTMQKIIEIVWDKGDSLVGPARGSATGFLSCYLLGITQMDPMKWNLPHWRHLTETRPELPDIDFDTQASRRKKILNAVREFFNKDMNPNDRNYKFKDCWNVLNIATFGTEGPKSACLTACFKKGTKVDTINGEKNIENIISGDYVKTLDGYEQVLYPTIIKGKPNYSIKTKNSVNKNFICTEDHEILTIKAKRRVAGKSNSTKAKEYFPFLKNYKSTDSIYDLYVRNFKEVEPEWTKAKNIVNGEDYGLNLINLDINDTEYIEWKNDFHKCVGVGISTKIEISNEFCELIGIWLAEGGIDKSSNAISFTIHKDEKALCKRIIQLMWQVFKIDNFCIINRQTSATQTISYSSSQLAQFFFELFGNTGLWKDKRKDSTYHYLTQWDKKLPDVLKYIHPQKQLQIIKGWFLGDGYARDNSPHGRSMKITTVSKQLAKDMLELFHRNFINPSVDIEDRSLINTNKCESYNLSLYGEYATLFYNLKYINEDFSSPLYIPENIRRKDDIPVLYKNKLYMKTKLFASTIENSSEEDVYCLKMPNGNFSVNNTIVHNCRGYRSEEYPDGIDSDVAQFLTAMIPAERGFTWPLKDCLYGNEEKGRKPIKQFGNEIAKYPNLLEIMLSIEGIVNKRSSHASGVYIYNTGFLKHNAMMRTPKGVEITQFNMSDSDYMGSLKYDFLTVEALDKLRTCMDLLLEDGEIEYEGSLKKTYDKYLHPDVLDYDNPEIWKLMGSGEVINLFQFDTAVGSQCAKKLKPHSLVDAASANSLMRLMAEQGAEQPMDRYLRMKNNIQLWYQEMKRVGLTAEEVKILEPHYLPVYGTPNTQEDMMETLMNSKITNFDLTLANKARKIVAKKKMKEVAGFEELFYQKGEETGARKIFLTYVWNTCIKPQLG